MGECHSTRHGGSHSLPRGNAWSQRERQLGEIPAAKSHDGQCRVGAACAETRLRRQSQRWDLGHLRLQPYTRSSSYCLVSILIQMRVTLLPQSVLMEAPPVDRRIVMMKLPLTLTVPDSAWTCWKGWEDCEEYVEIGSANYHLSLKCPVTTRGELVKHTMVAALKRSGS